MKFKIKITKSAVKDYRKINTPFKERINDKINKLAKLGLDTSNIKALTGELKGLYRLRTGDYRIVFNIEKELITIIAIHHRKDAY